MRFDVTEHRGKIAITLSVMTCGSDGIFWLHGGDLPHIGAVAVNAGDGKRQLTLFPGHREDGIVEILSKQLEESGHIQHAVVCGGIHYNDIPKEWIPTIEEMCRTLGERALAELGAGPRKETSL